MIHRLWSSATQRIFMATAVLTMALFTTIDTSAQTADTSPRFALVFGNAAYTAPDQALKNPVADARLMARTLRELKFDVSLREDMDRRSMLAALQEFSAVLRKTKGIGFLYFAGHGVQVNGRNYIVPIGANLVSDVDAQRNALDVDAIVQNLRDTGARLNIVVLDACRNNPLLATGRSVNGSKAQPGLAPMRPPEGALVAFATEPGRLASDGKEAGNGLYTRHLARWIKEPNIIIEQVFKRTREAVKKESQGEQIPTEYSVLTGEDLYLVSPPVTVLGANGSTTTPNTATTEKRGDTKPSRSVSPDAVQSANSGSSPQQKPSSSDISADKPLSSREILAKQGIFWDNASFLRALIDSDYQSVALFIQGGWDVRSAAPKDGGNALGVFAVLAWVEDEKATVNTIKLLATKLDLTGPTAQFRGFAATSLASNAILGCNLRMLQALDRAGVNIRMIDRSTSSSRWDIQPPRVDPIAHIREWGELSPIDGRPCSKETRNQILKLAGYS